MNYSVEPPFRRAATVLAAYQSNLDDAATWADASWATTLLRLDATQSNGLRRMMRRASGASRAIYSRALADAAGVTPPHFDVLMQPALVGRAGAVRPNAALLDALPAENGLQVLRMRSLLFRRAEARRLIDKRARVQLSKWVRVGVDRLTQDALLAEAPDISALIACAAMPPLAALDATMLAVEGCVLLLRDLADSATDDMRKVPGHLPFPLLRLALPRVLPALPWLTAVPRELDAFGSARLFGRLAELLPEFTWLFG